jgi:hypothetical protein
MVYNHTNVSLGTCVLSTVQERATRLFESDLECRQLEECC